MTHPRLPGAALVACAFCLSPLAGRATTVDLAADGQWQTFNVSDIDSQSFGVEWIDMADSNAPGYGSPLTFAFTVAAGSVATLTVVDAGFAGDTYTVTNHGAAIGSTSAVPPAEYDPQAAAQLDFDAALADPAFSHGAYTLGAGTYAIGGVLGQSVTYLGMPLDASVGGIRLTVSAVPEPSTCALLLAGLGAVGFVALRRRG